MGKFAPLVWLDVETTGLDPKTCTVLEVGLRATDEGLYPIIDGPGPMSITILPEEGLLIHEWPIAVVDMHSKSGLLTEVVKNGLRLEDAVDVVHGWLRALNNNPHVPDADEEGFVMAGSTVGQFDRQIIQRLWPEVVREFFHYRVVDVSSFKEVVYRRYGEEGLPPFLQEKEKAHRALDDIQVSIDELKFYLDTYFKKPVL